MKILITGGTGLIGRRFIAQFQHHNYTVLTRSVQRAKTLLPDTVSYIQSLSEIKSLDKFDAVINLAGEPVIDKRWTEKQKKIICNSRWDITRQLVELFSISNTPPTVFISGSAIGIYGEFGNQWIDETKSASKEDFAFSICERWEAIAKAAEPYTRIICLRTGIVLDCEGGALQKMLLPFKLCLGGKIASGAQFISWIHIQDMVRAMEFLLICRSCTGVYNITSPNPLTNKQFTDQLASVLNRIAWLPIPRKLLSLVMGESSQMLLASQRVTPEKLLQSGFEFSFPELRSALSDLLRETELINP